MPKPKRSVRKTPAAGSRQRQGLGFAVMLLALGAAFAGSRTYSGAATEAALTDAGAATDASAAVAAEPVESAPSTEEIKAHIEDVSARYGVDPRLVAAIIAVESEFDPHAVSRRGAEGLMQLMPATAASYDVQDSFDVRDNIEGGVRHLRRLMDRFRHDIPLALAAYNAGEQAVVAYHGIPPYRETRRYVVRVLFRYDREAARAVARRFTGPATPKPALSRATRVMFVAPAASVPALDAGGRSIPVRLPAPSPAPRPARGTEAP